MAPSLNRAARPHIQHAVTTSILLGNLHCPSCVATIRDALQEACPDHIRWVSPNIVTSVVTVEHDPEASHRDMVNALVDAGFDICSVTSSTGDVIFDSDLQPPSISEPVPSSQPYHLDDIHEDAGEDGEHSLSSGQKGKAAEDMADMASPSKSAPASSWGLSPLVRWMSGPRVDRDRPSSIADRIAQAHLSNCEQCRQLRDDGKPTPTTAHQADGEPSGDIADEATLHEEDLGSSRGSSDTSNTKVRQLSTAGSSKTALPTPDMPGNSFVTVEGEDAPSNRLIWRANLAIGGMTCAVCVNTIADSLKNKNWIVKTTVNLISNSAAVDFDDKTKEADIVEAIEDLGYDATIDSVVCLNPPKPSAAKHSGDNGALDDEIQSHERTVEIHIDGLYCEHCPDRIVRSLEGFRRPSLEIITKPTPQRPIIKLQYAPEAPAFTIRHILAAIEASDTALSATIHHPPTLEQRSKMIQLKHQRQIMYRVIGTGVIAIPTFIIGIVFMSLLPSSNHVRMYMMMPWTSGISRAQIALFIMATPVYFFGADIFHVRAVKEIRALWRRSSRTPFLQRFYRFGSMNMLMSLGTTIAFVSSVSQMIAAAVHKASEVSDANFYFDSVVFLTFFLLCGRLIESYSKSRTGDAVEMLGKLRPSTAILVEESTPSFHKDKEVLETVESVNSAAQVNNNGNSTGREIQADLLDFGDVVRILHGASPPADGVIVQGNTNFDESSLTGESRLVSKTIGDNVFSGTVNKDAPVLVRVTGTSGTSMLDQIVAVVREGQTKRAPMEQIADLLTTYFVPVVTLVAISTWIIWLSLGLGGRLPGHYLDVSSGGWVAFSLQFAISVFVVACPCGLGLAAPTAIFVASGMAAKYGILAKGGGEAFEKASRIDCVVFDKTGTLTMGGEPTVTDSAVFTSAGDEIDGSDTASTNKKSDLLAALKAVEENSGHPVAKAIVSFCAADAGASSRRGHTDELKEIAGRGMRATYNNQAGRDRSFEIIVGNEALMKDYAVSVSDHASALLEKWKTEAKSVALAATRPLNASDTQGWVLSAAMSISDPVRPEAASILAALQARGVIVYMLSGDNAVTAAAVARQLGIPADQVIAEVLPTEKAAKIQDLQSSLEAHTTMFGRSVKSKNDRRVPPSSNSRRAVVAMVGDGINDSPALTQADVGIAVGSGSDVAISSADFVLVQSNLQSVVTLLELSRTVFRRIAFNFGWALVYNVIAVPIAAGALYPIRTSTTSHVRLDPVWASLAMALSSISVVMSSLALRSRIPGVGFRPTVVKVPATQSTSS
ncbi:copper-transporting atpase 1 [Ophiostoma piceae UAMH 11346]|uniref:Copper-transporting atpase 1 n=1 Tax=Ophiostoma piceae (strain UAMH 11346) TaxID=1262450 RepID=S3C7D7_OPHP1|nr:copper-transporting atpase 1 [Ophiostoma piceae UAMH 11346]